MKNPTKTGIIQGVLQTFNAKDQNTKIGNHRGKGVKKPHKLGIIQSVLQTLNAKLQNKKICTTIYSVCVCVYVCVCYPVPGTEQCDQIMRRWCSKPKLVTAQYLDSAI